MLFSAAPGGWALWRPHLERACAARGLAVDWTQSPEDPASIDYLVYAPGGPVADFAPFTRLRAVLSLWAGVERILETPNLAAPLCRMVDPGLTEGMVEWVTGHILRYHLGLDRHIARQDGTWRHDLVPPLARDRRIGILGLGVLGLAVARSLAALNFQVHGWSARPKHVEGLTAHPGPEGLAPVLAQSEILVTLLPETPQTQSLLDGPALARLPRGARLINPGRGTVVDDAALLAALDSGRLAHATLDVFRTEPLPPSHPFWAHPHVTVTPHIASETRPETAATVIAENIRRSEAGLPLLHLVDRGAGY